MRLRVCVALAALVGRRCTRGRCDDIVVEDAAVRSAAGVGGVRGGVGGGGARSGRQEGLGLDRGVVVQGVELSNAVGHDPVLARESLV